MTTPVLAHETWADNAQALLIAAGLCGGSVTRNRDTPSADDDLPTADIFIGDDQASSDDRRGNQGPLDFTHVAKLGIEIRRKANSGEEGRAELAIDAALVMNTLLPRFFLWAAEAEGCPGYRIAYLTATEGQFVETRVAIQIDIASRSSWPAPADDLPNLEFVRIDAGNGVGALVPVPTSP